MGVIIEAATIQCHPHRVLPLIRPTLGRSQSQGVYHQQAGLSPTYSVNHHTQANRLQNHCRIQIHRTHRNVILVGGTYKDSKRKKALEVEVIWTCLASRLGAPQVEDCQTRCP
jgi:hypothetical protein